MSPIMRAISGGEPDGGHKEGGKLTYGERQSLHKSSFVFPGERRYPIEDKSHARNALARVSQFGSSAEKAKVRAAVHIPRAKGAACFSWRFMTRNILA